MVKISGNKPLNNSIRELIIHRYFSVNGNISLKELSSYYCSYVTAGIILSKHFAK